MNAKHPVFEQARRAVNRSLIESYFKADGARWKDKKYFTLSPLRPDNNVKRTFAIIENSNGYSYCDKATGDTGTNIIDLTAARFAISPLEAAEKIIRDTGGAVATIPETKKEKKEVTGFILDCYRKRNKSVVYNSVKDYLFFDFYDDKKNLVFTYYRSKTLKGAAISESDNKVYFCLPDEYNFKFSQPLYNLSEILQHKDKTVVIVEGLRKCESAKEYFKMSNIDDYVFTSFSAGSNSVEKSNYNVLKNRNVILWADNDKAGTDAMNQAAGLLKNIVNSVKSICLDDWKDKEKYDIEDLIKDGGFPLKYLSNALPIVNTDGAELTRAPEPTPAAVGCIDFDTSFIRQQTEVEKLFSKEKKRSKEILDKLLLDESSYLSHARDALLKEYLFRKNIINNKYEISLKEKYYFEEFSDNQFNTIYAVYKTRFKKNLSKDDLRTLIESNHVSKEYNPVLEYLSRLPKYNNKNYINQMAGLIKLKNENERKLLEKYFKMWLVSSLAMWTGNSINHTCFVLIGKQGNGKTTFCTNLIPDELSQFINIGRFEKDKDSDLILSDNLLLVLDELETSTKSEIGILKSAMTKAIIKRRRPYGHYEDSYPRRAAFCGSANKAQILTDTTGNRRFLIFETETIDYKNITDELRNGIWTESLHLFNSGFTYHLTQEEIEILSTRNDRFREIFVEEELFLKCFKPIEWNNANKDQKKKTSEILLYLQSKHPDFRLSEARLGNVLRKHCVRNKDKDTNDCYAYSVRYKEPDEKEPEENPITNTNGEIPFNR